MNFNFHKTVSYSLFFPREAILKKCIYLLSCNRKQFIFFQLFLGGFYHSEILLKHMISAYVPFLPLERKHVKQCIEDFLIEKLHFKPGTIPKKKVSEIAGEMSYFPKDSDVFSVFGCKRVQEKVILLISE